jgi:hypothetical protein
METLSDYGWRGAFEVNFTSSISFLSSLLIAAMVMGSKNKVRDGLRRVAIYVAASKDVNRALMESTLKWAS